MHLSGKKTNFWLKNWWVTLTSKRWTLTEIVAFVFIVIGSILRLWNLPASMQFVGDQGRDALIVAKIFKELDFVFIGPVTSVGNMYLGPLYYYFMVPWLWLTYPSPVGPAYAVAFLGIATTVGVFFIGRQLIGERAALIATGFFATTAVFVEYARFSWNPNPVPFIMILLLYTTYRSVISSPKWWTATAALLAMLLQMHYVTLVVVMGAGLLWLYQLKKEWRIPQFWLATIAGVVIVLISIFPLVLFDAKHGWVNVQAFQKLVFKEDNFKKESLSVSGKIFHMIRESEGRGMQALFEITIGKNRKLNSYLLIFFIGSLLALRVSTKKNTDTLQNTQGRDIVLLFFAVGVFGTTAYEHSIFDHYIAFLFPVNALILGMVFDWWLHRSKVLGGTFLLIFLMLFIPYNIKKMPLKSAGWQITHVRSTSQKIIDSLSGIDTYGLVLLSESKDLYAQNYRYYLYALGKPPVNPENTAEAQALVIINENQPDINIATSPIYEIATYPSKKLTRQYIIEGGPTIMIVEK